MARPQQIDGFPNLVSLFFARVEEGGDTPFLWHKQDRTWQSLSWREVGEKVAALAESLVSQGLKAGDRVVIVSENRPEWFIADLGIMAAGCVSVPTYTTNTERDHQHILDNSGARAVIVSTAKLARTVMPAALRSAVASLIVMDEFKVAQQGDLRILNWADLLVGGADKISTVISRANTV
ncbi:MAG: AMP-binding protein, partial [Sphingopyxis sp.]